MMTHILLVFTFLLNPLAGLVDWDDCFSKASASNRGESSSFAIDSIELKQIERGILPLVTASVSDLDVFNPNFLPVKKRNAEEVEVNAESALVALVDCGEDLDQKDKNTTPVRGKILFQKNSREKLPIASLTKIMTAMVALENLDPEEKAVVSKQALATYGEMGNLRLDEEISVKKLLEALLIESSNDAAAVLAEKTEQKTGKDFEGLMNQKAEELNLKDTHFEDSSGLDSGNISSVNDLHLLVRHAFGYPLIWDIMQMPVKFSYRQNGSVSHRWVNTNKLLNRIPGILGGKTGYTHEAKECFAMAVRKEPRKCLITVILGSDDRFRETKKLFDWAEEAYKWNN